MNSKTTILMAALLAGLVLGYVGIRRKIPDKSSSTLTPATKTDGGLARDLLADPLGNVVKVAARRGSEEWIFEKKAPPEGGAAVWHMVKPMEAKVLSQEIDRIAREAGKIQYEISHEPGQGAVTAADAGLSPPAATITLTDDTGKTATIEVGKPVSEHETYARKAGDETIVVAKSNLRKLLKAKPIEYRDLQLWNFVPENVTRVEVCEPSGADQKVECLYLAREGGKWMFEKPFSARATGKVDEMLKAVARLRVTGWHDDDPAKLKVYGLDPGALQIALTVEETIAPEVKPGEDAAQDSPPAPPEKKVKHYKLQVADRGPIGEDTKVFVRSGDDHAVATIFKSAADKFKPVMNDWRDMQVVAADATKAERIELNLGGNSTVLVQKDGEWTFEADGSAAEAHAVTELLAAIKGLKAVSFVESAEAGSVPGFDAPQAEFRLTIPGVEGVERITVGGYTDPAKKLLVFVRRGETGPVAKVKASDITALVKPPSSLRDRTVFNFDADRAARLELVRPNEFVSGGRQSFTLEKKDGGWMMSAPAKAPVHADKVEQFVAVLGTLKADSIVAESEEATAFGLHEPAFSVGVSFAAAGEGDSDPVPGPLQLAVTQHDGKTYASRGDGGPIYELGKIVLEQLGAEFRSGEAVEFEPKDVERMALKSAGESNSFVRKSGKWVLESEPDLPIDSAKIDKILTEAKAVKPEQFAAYSSDQLGSYGLEQPHHELSLTLNKQAPTTDRPYMLRVSEKTVNHTFTASPPSPDSAKPAAPQSTTAGFATLAGHEGVFLLSSDAIKKIFVPLSELEKK